MDDGYAPGSKDFRERTLGADWSLARMKAATNQEFAEAFLGAVGASPPVKDVTVLSQVARFSSTELVVSYTSVGGQDPGPRQRTLNLMQSNDCWTVEMPNEAWHRLEEAVVPLKATRPNDAPARVGPSSVALRLTQASFTEAPGMVEARQKGVAGPQGRVWLSESPVITEADVESAIPGSDCEASAVGPDVPSVLLTFSKDGADRLRRWSTANMGKHLAVTVRGEPLVVAKVAGILGNRLSLCLRDASMASAHELARQLMGWQQ